MCGTTTTTRMMAGSNTNETSTDLDEEGGEEPAKELSLSFASFEELQTTLILSPYHDSLGAIVTHGDYEGYRFIKLGMKDLRDDELSRILSEIRAEAPPIVIVLQRSTETCESTASTSTVRAEDEELSDKGSQDDHENEISSAKPSWSGLASSWTTRLQAGAQLAAASAASAAAKAAAAARQQQVKVNEIQETTSPDVAIYLHTSSGAYLPLSNINDNAPCGELKLTNSSLLSVRKSATSPCSAQCSFQWFCGKVDDTAWTVVEGATDAAIQPSATEIGYRLRCVVSIAQDSDSETEEKVATSVICETGVISADHALFNGSRQALVRGATFGGLIGQGNASSRVFRVTIQVGKKRGRTCAAATICQVSGRTAEPLHGKPIPGISARSEGNKSLEIIFSHIPSDGMIAALANQNRMVFQCPNRLARESMLLTIGIANYQGEPSQLDATTVLFDGLLFDEEEGDMSDSSNSVRSCSSMRSGASRGADDSSVHSQTSPGGRPPLSASSSGGTTRGIDHPRSFSFGDLNESKSRQVDMEKELELLRDKLEKKNKVIAELQRQITKSDTVAAKATQQLASCEKTLKLKDAEHQSIQQALRLTTKKVTVLEKTVDRLKCDHNSVIDSLQEQIESQAAKIAEWEKTARTLQNEKAVLSAAVEARESKLSKLGELQASYSELEVKLAKGDTLQKDIVEIRQRYDTKCGELEKCRVTEASLREEVSRLRVTVETLNKQLKNERLTTSSHQAQLEQQQHKVQRLIAERNSYKQKNDSLSKEIGRVCRNGRAVADVEKIIADDSSRRQEVELLREQKRKALEELEYYRTAYEHSQIAQRMAGLDHDSAKLLERNVELERLLSEITEYLNAKEMQLETMKQVNVTLQSELRDLAKANMSRNDV